MIRTFIAIELDKAVTQKLAHLNEELDWGEASIKWVKPANIHLTLRFLGDIKPKKVKAISALIPTLFNDWHAFDVDIHHLGAFPTPKHPKVIWAGIKAGDDQVVALATELERKLCLIGYPKEKREFSSHITIGRVRSSKRSDNIDQTIGHFSFDPPITQRIHTITFFQSTLTPQGPIYERLAQVHLKAK